MLASMTRKGLQVAAMALLAMEAASASQVLDALEKVLREEVAADGVVVWLVDYRLRTLQVVPRSGSNPDEYATVLPIEGSSQGRVFASQTLVHDTFAGKAVLLLPITVRNDRLGVLECVLPRRPTLAQEEDLLQIAGALGHAITVANRDTDVFEKVSRAQRLSVAAELQWQLLPGRGCGSTGFCVAGQLEPAYHVASDNFDWCVSTEHLYLSVSDATGQGMPAALLTTLAVNALRNARRADLPLAEQVSLADHAVHSVYDGKWTVATMVLEIERSTGRATAVDAGASVLLRQRGSTIEPIVLDKQLPLGLFEDTAYFTESFDIRANDRLVVVSDGVHGAQPSGRPQFGEERLASVIRRLALLEPQEAARHLIRELLAYHDDEELSDDAVVVVCDWSGSPSMR